jgi:hypothetical protein
MSLVKGCRRKKLEQVQVAVGHFEIEIVHRQIEHGGVNILERAVAGVRDEISAQTFGGEFHRFHGDGQFFGTHGKRGLVDLDDFATGGNERFHFLADYACQGQSRSATVGVKIR